jgi:cytochrome c oxidase cbb3-type subunit 1
METALIRAGRWFGLLFLALAAVALAEDSAFAVHMTIVAVVAFAALVIGVARTDVDAIANVVVRAPVDPSRYDDDPVRWGVIATVGWSIVGFLAGLVIALQLAFPLLNIEPWFNFGRLRPLHTSGVIFAFGGNVLIATSYYVVQRTCRTRLAFPGLARFVFWGYQLFIVLAASGYLLGITQSREYAEPEWYVDRG